MKETKIRWAGSTWNVFTGCTEVSPGCDRCYAKVIAEKFRGGPAFPVGFDPKVLHKGRTFKVSEVERTKREGVRFSCEMGAVKRWFRVAADDLVVLAKA